MLRHRDLGQISHNIFGLHDALYLELWPSQIWLLNSVVCLELCLVPSLRLCCDTVDNEVSQCFAVCPIFGNTGMFC